MIPAEKLREAVEAMKGIHTSESGVSWEVSNRVEAVSRKAVLDLIDKLAEQSAEPGVAASGLLARWPEADLFAALDAEGWFRGMDTAEATAAVPKVYARLAAAPAVGGAALDVERLARAMNATIGMHGWLRASPSDPPEEWRVNAEAIAREYEATP